MKVIRDEAITRALREEGCQDNNEDSFAVSGRAKEDAPALFGNLSLQSDRGLDLAEFFLNKGIISVSVRVVLSDISESQAEILTCSYLDEDCKSFFQTILRAQPLKLH